MFRITDISIILFITTLINFSVALISWQRRKSRGGIYIATGMVGLTIWTLAQGFDYAATSIPLKVFFAKVEALGYLSALPLFTLFTLSYAGYEEWIQKRSVQLLFLTITISNILLVWTNELHGLFWSGFIVSSIGDHIVSFEHGPAFTWVTITGYLMILTLIAVLWQVSRKGSQVSQRQGRLLLFSALIPVASNLVYLMGIGGVKGIDWTSVTFSATGLLFLIALNSARLLDIVPIARDRLVSGLRDGMIVLDLQHRIIDVNPVAANILGLAPAFLIEKHLVDVAPMTREVLETAVDQERRTEWGFGTTQTRYFDVLLSPVRDKANEIIGRLIILHDITSHKENELRFLQLNQAVEQSPASVVITDLQGQITYVNPRFSALTGYRLDEIVGKNPRIIQSGQTPVEIYKEMWQTLRSGNTWRGELLNKKKNGELYWEFEVIAPVLDQDGNTISFIAVKEDITERKKAEAALEQRFLEIQELHRNLQETQAQLVEQQRTMAILDERRRLGRNMHDSVNQSIHSLMLFSETLVALLEKDQKEKALYIAHRIEESGRQALKEIRLLVYETQAHVTDEDMNLISALEERLTMVERRVGVKAELTCKDSSLLKYYPQEWNENLFWMITEALNNSLKYAQARSINVMIVCTLKQLRVEIVDDGVGFDSGHRNRGGFGMRSMCERAEILGGQLSVESSPGKGTRIWFMVNTGGTYDGEIKDPDRR